MENSVTLTIGLLASGTQKEALEDEKATAQRHDAPTPEQQPVAYPTKGRVRHDAARREQVIDPFHVVKHANSKLDECRRRVQNETECDDDQRRWFLPELPSGPSLRC